MLENMIMSPTWISEVDHRSDVDLSCNLGGIKLSIPIILAPMPCCSNGQFVGKFSRLGGLGLIHRFLPIQEQITEYVQALCIVTADVDRDRIGCAIGVVGDYLERFNKLYKRGCRLFCLDTANGGHKNVLKAIEEITNIDYRVKLIVGNVSHANTYHALARHDNVISVRCGIGGGANCTTTLATGISTDPQRLLFNIYKYYIRQTPDYTSKMCWDGGIKSPGDVNKLLAIGYNHVMIGSLFGACSDSPAPTYDSYKRLSGNASHATQFEFTGQNPTYIEGITRQVPIGESLHNTMQKFRAGLQSCFSYFNAKNIEEFRKNVNFEFLD